MAAAPGPTHDEETETVSTPYTQAEEVVYWHGFDDGGSRDGITGSRCRYHDRGLVDAYENGFANGRADTTGRPFPCPAPGGPEELQESPAP